MINNVDFFEQYISKERVLRWAILEYGAYHLTLRQLEIIGLNPDDYEWYGSRYDKYFIVPVNDTALIKA